MFERRLRIVLLVLVLVVAAIGLRAAQVQISQHAAWQEQAARRQSVSELLETTRGRILDVKGRELALNAACIDACVDYRAIVPVAEEREGAPLSAWAREQKAWVRQLAARRLVTTLGDAYRRAEPAQKRQMLQDQVNQVKADIAAMWSLLGSPDVTGATREQVEELRHTIIRRVEMRRRYLWYTNYASAAREHQARDPLPWYTRLLADEQAQAPELDQFDITVGEQYEPHVILPAIDSELANFLGKNLDRYPGLTLQRSQHRRYPYGSAASHVIGYLGRVNREEVALNPGVKDPLRGYWPHDLIGRSGAEALGEATLRGVRGERVTRREDERVLSRTEAAAGGDVHLTLDIELQRRIEQLFAHSKRSDGSRDPGAIHGAAVVIDVPSGEIRALASYPTYDLNEFDRLYSKMAADDINRPLLHRAMQAQLEPGSTVKPVVALAALADGVLQEQETLHCTGYLILGGRRYQEGKCHDAHAHGSIGVVAALEQSCNVFHETLADRLGLQRLSRWYADFGMGMPVGIGLAEPVSLRADGSRRTGRLPRDFEGPAYLRAVTTWFAGIGQGSISTTPLQMANVAATLARDGEWVRPVLWTEAPRREGAGADRVKLNVPPAAMAAVRRGMVQVVEGPAGTARSLRTPGVHIAGKTGTAQAARFSVPERDERGQVVRVNGRVQRVFLEPSTAEKPNPQAPWYRATGRDGNDLAHSWFIGFAPAERPTIAFAVLVEYGGSGGTVAGGITRELLEAAIEEGYLPTS